MENSYAIIGRGGLYAIIKEILVGYTFSGYYDDKSAADPEYIGPVANVFSEERSNVFIAIAAIRNMLLRERLIAKLNEKKQMRLNALSPHAYIAESAKMGKGNIVCPFACVHSDVTIGDGCIVFSNTAIEHDGILGTNVNIGPGVTLAGSIHIGNNVFIGAGTVIKDGIIIGDNTVIGAGSVVLKNISPNVVAYGNPCKEIRSNTLYKAFKG